MSEEQKNYCCFIRIGKREFMEKLYHEGEIYCNTLDYFRSLPSTTKMADSNDGNIRLIQAKNIKLKFSNTTLLYDSGQFQMNDPNLKGNLYCLFGLETVTIEPTEHFKKINLDVSAIDWGDTAVLIYDTKEFLNRMELAFKRARIEFKLHPITYYDTQSYHGNLSIFDKSKEFEKQSEIRYWIANPNNEPIKIYLGDLSDISELIDRMICKRLNMTINSLSAYPNKY